MAQAGSFANTRFEVSVARLDWVYDEDYGEVERIRTDIITGVPVTWDFSELERKSRDYGLSCLTRLDSPYPVFVSQMPEECQESFEQAIERFYELRILKVDGNIPTQEQLCELAKELDMRIEGRGQVAAQPSPQ